MNNNYEGEGSLYPSGPDHHDFMPELTEEEISKLSPDEKFAYML